MAKSADRRGRGGARAGASPYLLLFAAGDFAFNLYWQSVSLFLLFYYTDAIRLQVATAAAIYTVASVWDGIASFAAGLIADRRVRGSRHGLVIAGGALPLGLAFALTYLPPVTPGGWGVALVCAGHLLFRTAYAGLNVPYLAMSARVSVDSRGRAFVAGMRMLFGTAAAVLVARGTVPLGRWLSGSDAAAAAYSASALLFAAIGTAVLVVVGLTYREAPGVDRPAPPGLRASLAALAANRAFVTLNLAMMAMIVAVTVLGKSVLYYFRYFLGDDAGGQSALALMGVVGTAAIPAWMLLQRVLGTRRLWFVAAGLCMTGLTMFFAMPIGRTPMMQLFLAAMAAAMVGLHFTFWAMLPDTVDHGAAASGLRVEGAVFGMAALLQRVAIGAATAILGVSFALGGYVANANQAPATLVAMRWTMALVPIAFLLLACAAMRASPLGRCAAGLSGPA